MEQAHKRKQKATLVLIGERIQREHKRNKRSAINTIYWVDGPSLV